MSDNRRVDFSLIDLPLSEEKKKPFIEQVEMVLTSDMQQYDTFGCLIRDCHTHAGSKLHFKSFIEAELLFHNSDYNKSFAKLTLEHLKNELDNSEIKNVLLIGYEKYSELYIYELKELIKLQEKKCEYCVYETTSEMMPSGAREVKTDIRDLCFKEENGSTIIKWAKGDKSQEIWRIKDTLCVFIVPINTSLSTMDKMVAKFHDKYKRDTRSNNRVKDYKEKYICLITIGEGGGESNINEKEGAKGNKKNVFFKESEKQNGIIELVPTENKFEHLKKKSIDCFVKIDVKKDNDNDESNTVHSKDCKDCFPPKKNDPDYLKKEKPIFDVNRGSVVPMLELNAKRPVEPLDENLCNERIANFAKVIELSEFLTYRHIVRGDNHYQYYFDTEKYLQSIIKENNNELEDFFKIIHKKLFLDCNNQKDQIFDYLVAPRHESNAAWVGIVNKSVFNNRARIIHLDVEKELRNNVKTKYSDITASLENIKNSGQAFKIRFHYVDDAPYSGDTFLRAENLFLSLTDSIKDNIYIFDSAIFLINRISDDSKKFYLGKNNHMDDTTFRNSIKDRFFAYVDVSISPMRNYEDACTLCKLRSDYHIIRDQSATNVLSDICSNVIDEHQMTSPRDPEPDFDKKKEIENRWIFIIAHLLKERVNNRMFFEKDARAIELAADKDKEIKKALDWYYDPKHITKELDKILKKPKKTNSEKRNAIKEYIDGNDDEKYKIAFIKAISRPFLTYNIRFRQAAFSFCLERIEEIRSNTKEPKQIRKNRAFKSYMMQTLVKAMSDMNASYLVRKEVLDFLLKWAEAGDGWKEEGNCRDDKKKYFTSDSLIHYLKKNIVLSNDETKSLYLENVLLKQEEPWGSSNSSYSNPSKSSQNSGIKDFICDDDNSISTSGRLYLENNTILKTVLSNEANRNKFIDNNQFSSVKPFYFFENFVELWELNLENDESIKKDKYKTILEKYDELLKIINEFAGSNANSRKDFSKAITDMLRYFSQSGTDSDEPMMALTFVHDESEKNILFKYFTLEGDEPYSEGYYGSFDRNDWFNGLTTVQAFFHDENIDEIEKAIKDHKDKDIFFINDCLTFGEKNNKKSLIVRFGKDKDGEKGLYQDRKDESVYVQIWNFNKNNQSHWFALKLLLTLRGDMAKLIADVNLQELIEERKVEMQRLALSINKAATHSQAEIYMKENVISAALSREETDIKSTPPILSSDIEKILKSECESVSEEYSETISEIAKLIRLHDMPSEQKIYDKIMRLPVSSLKYRWIVFDLYRQLLADEAISTLYRNTIKGNIKTTRDENLKNNIYRFFNHNRESDNRGITVFTSARRRHLAGKCVVCDIKFDSNANCSHNSFNVEYVLKTSNIPCFALIIILAAKNVILHTDEKELSVTFSEEQIEMKNKCQNYESDNEKYWHIPPWLFQDTQGGQHITLWTLLHLERAMNDNKHGKISCEINHYNSIFTISFTKK